MSVMVIRAGIRMRSCGSEFVGWRISVRKYEEAELKFNTGRSRSAVVIACGNGRCRVGVFVFICGVWGSAERGVRL